MRASWAHLPFRDEDFDPYQIEGFDRPHIKLALNIMLNADTELARAAPSRENSRRRTSPMLATGLIRSWMPCVIAFRA